MITSTREFKQTTVELAPGPDRVSVRSEVSGDPAAVAMLPRITSLTADLARICWVPDGALFLADDRIRLEVIVRAGVRAEFTEAAGTVAYDMRGSQTGAVWDVVITVEDGASLVWDTEPFVVSAGATVERTTTITLAARARLAMREVLVLGRSAERPGVLRQRLRVHTANGCPILAEDLSLGAHAQQPGRLGRNRVIGSVLALGFEPEAPSPDPTRCDLEAGGAQWRRLSEHAHDVQLERAWQAALAGAR